MHDRSFYHYKYGGDEHVRSSSIAIAHAQPISPLSSTSLLDPTPTIAASISLAAACN
jgi:hypothetical protein